MNCDNPEPTRLEAGEALPKRFYSWRKQIDSQATKDISEGVLQKLRVLRSLGKTDQALEEAWELAKQSPLDSFLYEFIGETLTSLGRHEEALASLEQAQEAFPESEAILLAKATVQTHLKQYFPAIKTYGKIVALNSTQVPAWVNTTKILVDLNRCEEALAIISQAYDLLPDNSDVLFTKGYTLQKLGRRNEALECFDKRQRLFGDDLETLFQSSQVHLELGNFETALDLIKKIVTIDPHHIGAMLNKALVYSYMGLLDKSIEASDEVLELAPDNAPAQLNKGFCLLKSGQFETGWYHYDKRLQIFQPATQPDACTRWAGQNLAGKSIFLSSEQGLGDQIQFVRYADRLSQQGATVVVECNKALISLFKSCPGVTNVIEKGTVPSETDFYSPILSVAGILKENLSRHHTTPYLYADAVLIDQWARRLQHLDGFKVGINWQGSTTYKGDQWRSIPLAQFSDIATLDHVQLVSLQKGQQGVSQIPDFLIDHELLDIEKITQNQSNLPDAAAIIMNLDLVITSCTAIAHLSGALGVPTWVALCQSSDWRWLTHRDDTPWYPNVRLFRQQTHNNWNDVFQQMRGALKLEIQQKLFEVP